MVKKINKTNPDLSSLHRFSHKIEDQEKHMARICRGWEESRAEGLLYSD